MKTNNNLASLIMILVTATIILSLAIQLAIARDEVKQAKNNSISKDSIIEIQQLVIDKLDSLYGNTVSKVIEHSNHGKVNGTNIDLDELLNRVEVQEGDMMISLKYNWLTIKDIRGKYKHR